jgi:hypothetical protein
MLESLFALLRISVHPCKISKTDPVPFSVAIISVFVCMYLQSILSVFGVKMASGSLWKRVMMSQFLLI